MLSIRNVDSFRASEVFHWIVEVFHWIVAHGPRRISAVWMPTAARAEVVVDAIAYVEDCLGGVRHDRGDLLEAFEVGLAGAPIIGSADQIDVGGDQVPQDAARAYGLIAGDAEPPPVRAEPGESGPDIGVEVRLVEVLRLPGRGPSLALGGQSNRGWNSWHTSR